MTDGPQETAAQGWAGLRAQLREDLSTHEGDVWSAGFHTLAVHRFGTWHRAHGRRPWRRLSGMAYRFANRATRIIHGIELPLSATVGRRVRFVHQHGVVIHGQVEIGDDVLIRHGVTIGAGTSSRKGRVAPIIGNGVQISPGAVIMGPVTIGDGVDIGPNAVVTRSIKPGRVVFPNPPRVLELGGEG